MQFPPVGRLTIHSLASIRNCIRVFQLEFMIGYDLEEFKEYYTTLDDLHDFFKAHGAVGPGFRELGDDERQHIERDPSHLIVWKEKGEIIGHAIWHETTTDEMTPGDPRDNGDRERLHHLFEGPRENLVELHEVWLKSAQRGRGYGTQFFDCFEEFASKRGFEGIVYYTDNPAAVALCRKREYKEAREPLEEHGWFVFALQLGSRSS